jgi:hypothetical protein
MPSCIRIPFLPYLDDPMARDRSIALARHKCRPW